MCKQINNTTSSLLDIISSFEDETLTFYNAVASDTDSVFIDNTDFAKGYKKIYSPFSLVISHHISRCEGHILLLTNLIKKADNNNDSEETEALSEEFEKYVRFSRGVSNFINLNEDMIKQNNTMSKKDILISIQNLLTTKQHYKEELQPNK